MATNTDHSDPANDPNSRQNAILAQLAPHAIEFHKTLEIAASVPIATGYRGLEAQFIVHLPSIHTAQPDPTVVRALQDLLRRYQCDGVGIFSPINLQPHPEADNDADRCGLCIEIHVRGASPMRRVSELVQREADHNYFGPLTPCVGIPFGVIYPDLINVQHS